MNTVKITTDEYCELIESAVKLEMVIGFLFDGADLGWDNKVRLSAISSETAKALFPLSYEAKRKALLKEKEANNG